MRQLSMPQFDARACIALVATLLTAYVLLVVAVTATSKVVLTWMQQDLSFGIAEEESMLVTRILVDLLSPTLLVVTTLLFLKRYFPYSSWMELLQKFGFEKRASMGSAFISFCVGVALVLFFKEMVAAFPPGPLIKESPSSIVEHAQFWTQLVFAINLATFVPIAEEFVFRGVLYKGFMLSWNKVVAALVVCLLFTSAHVDSLRAGYWLSQLALISLSIVLVISREFTDSLYSPILIHAGFNFGSVFISE